ncbi:UPF0175 family protein [Pullulanibacillus sp. KACC 23026]|uniref:UPF0175 family protein n=1 Tax=Pullulanibacillus sp. KACC 23026 TaxID=3028315 RepID=UPI0023B00E24|nr:UPF0175 family protein [Pullulanibacillus sp. KACC 23026]WEG11163.1 UPF0175 family protein [Pullulanibacillus sp. KACC 23026]
MARKKRKRGHYCKGCGENRPNEKFNAKGRKQNLCKECQKLYRDEEDLFDSDDTFSFIAGYTDSGVPFGITHEEWEEMEEEEERRVKEIRFIYPDGMEEILHSIFLNQSTKQMLQSALAMTLFVTRKISMERAAFLTGVSLTDYLKLLHANGVSWQNELEDGYMEYRKSVPDLLELVDRIAKEGETDDETEEPSPRFRFNQ